MKERIKKLCKEKGVSMNKAEQEIGLAKGYISKLGKSNPNSSTLQKIANYFNVSVEFLISGKEEEEKESQKTNSLSNQEELDILKDVDIIIDKLKNGEEVVLRFNGEKTDGEGIELLRQSLLNTCRTAKLISKQKE